MICTDRVTKLQDYGEAGIPQYWMVDIDAPVSLAAHGLLPGRGYEFSSDGSGVFTTSTPCELALDLPALVRPPTSQR